MTDEEKTYLLETTVVGRRVKYSKYNKLQRERPELYEELGGNPDTIYKNIKKLIPRKQKGRKPTRIYNWTFCTRKPVGFSFKKKTESFDDFIDSLNKPYTKEGDVYVFGNIAVEYCDLMKWSEKGCKKGDLTRKSEDYLKRGVRSIHVFGDEWENRTDIVKSIIKTSLGIYDRRIFARKCKVRYLDKKEEKEFFNRCHLQGFSASRHCLGLIYKGEVVAAISLASPRFSKETDWELIRYANALNTQIIGGFSKLLSHFRKDYKGSITSYSDRRLFAGDLYRQIFKELPPSGEDYYYTEGTIRENRIKFQKYKLVNAFPEWANDTEWVIANRLGWYRIWGCGNWKFRLD